jgi:glycosyltransferase involved in cell wall biosynthesis
MKRIFFLIRSLERGGAERQLTQLAKGLVEQGFDITVCTFYDGGALRAELNGVAGLHLISLGKKNRWDVARFLVRLIRAVRRAKPDIIHAYMGIANELSVPLAWLVGARSVWGLRSSNMDLTRYDQVSLCAFQVGAFASRFADAIIVNSEAGRQHHVLHGYRADRMVVVHNGVDCERFKPDPAARARIRAEWGIAAEGLLIGLVARLDPKKDHPNFLRAAAELSRFRPNVRFVCVGDGREAYRNELQALARTLGLEQRLLWAGPRDDMASVYNALDVMVLSSSFGEGFPNVVGEAMATGRRCVVTDAGDAAVVVGAAGVVVPPNDSRALAAAVEQLLRQSEPEASALAEFARARIATHFSPHQLLDSTVETLLATLEGPSGQRSTLRQAPRPTAPKGT